MLLMIGALALFATACGGSSSESSTTTTDDTPAEQPTAVPTEVPAEPTEVPTEVPAEPTEVPAAPAYEPSATDDPALVDAGSAVFAASCSGCHGADGTGTDRGRPLLGIAEQQPDRLVHFGSVSNGKGNMPAFSTRLSGEEIDAALTYVRLTFLAAEAEPEAGADEGETDEAAAGGIDPAMIEVGTAVFAESCSGCHGAAGEGTSRGRPLIGISAEQPDTAVHVASITDGKGRMPAFGDKLSAEEIEAVVAYVHSEL